MAYSVDLREKAVLMIEKGKTKIEVAELMEIDSVPLVKKESCW
ncbi:MULTISPECIES: hypothetical protein [unclassified Wolbachia]|uniref:Transposase Synechocystis PCC 6803 domain-containing protein n=2 Tax=unclassified Wolbachia TaxID=2640676 RepID=A0A3B0IZH9_9RICK|nr:hypothetical protein [Wolbachia endosymbiont of Nilaparvata lugens]